MDGWHVVYKRGYLISLPVASFSALASPKRLSGGVTMGEVSGEPVVEPDRPGRIRGNGQTPRAAWVGAPVPAWVGKQKPWDRWAAIKNTLCHMLQVETAGGSRMARTASMSGIGDGQEQATRVLSVRSMRVRTSSPPGERFAPVVPVCGVLSVYARGLHRPLLETLEGGRSWFVPMFPGLAHAHPRREAADAGNTQATRSLLGCPVPGCDASSPLAELSHGMDRRLPSEKRVPRRT